MIQPGAVVFDVTIPICPGMPVWPGDPAVAVTPVLRITDGDAANVSQLTLSSHTGTHVDAPWHFIDAGAKLLEIAVERWIGPCFVIEFPDDIRRIEPEHLEAAGVPAGTERLVVKTANSARWADALGPFDPVYIALSPASARWVLDHGIEVVGIDAPSIEAYDDGANETHPTLLGAGILIVEGLDLRAVTPGPYTLVCLPLKLEAGDGAPARVLLVREG